MAVASALGAKERSWSVAEGDADSHSPLQSSGWLTAAAAVRGAWSSKCRGPGHPSVLPTGT